MPKVSIIIRSHNDAEFIERTMTAILEQEFKDFELINVDHCSTDGTWDSICSLNPDGIKFQVEEYIPGKVLNDAIAKASGEIVVFNNSDCIPVNDEWLGNLIYPLENNANLKIGAVYGNQLPRPDAKQLVKKDNVRAFGDGETASSWYHFFSLASSAVPRRLLIVNKFSTTLKYSEDIEWSWRMKQSGYKIIYVPGAMVEHSHNYSLSELKRRFYGEGYADGQIFGGKFTFVLGMLLPLCMEIIRDLEWLIKRFRLLAIPRGILYRIIQRVSYWRGRRDYIKDHPESLRAGSN